MPTHLRLGELLMKEGLLTESQLKKALKVQADDGGRLGEILVRLGMLSEGDLVTALGKQLHLPYAAGDSAKTLMPAQDQELNRLIPRTFAEEHAVLPLSRNLNSLTIAVADPLDLLTMDSLAKMTRCRINPIVAPRSAILTAIETFYGKDTSLLEEAIDSSYRLPETTADGQVEEVLSLDELKAKAEEAPVIRLVDLILRQAIQERASDIHIERQRERVSLRYRIDGVLYEMSPPAPALHLAITSRIKILAKMDIAEKRLPQDGGFMLELEGRPVDLRVSTIPTIYGEKVVLRILDKSPGMLKLSQLGFSANEMERFRKAITEPYGMILLTGPTGSGKTTTLYAAMNEIKSPQRNILTIEDPVEYRIDGINQVQIKPQIGLTFATGLRSFLRQDPDVIMVGEIRDLETAEISIRAGLTGHLVFSTVHTNDAPSAVTRLVDIGVPPFLLASTLTLVAAQRLIRLLCPTCKESFEPTSELLHQLGLKQPTPLYRAKGCAGCRQTGYKGRMAILELMLITPGLQHLITQGASAPQLREEARKGGMRTLWEAGVERLLEGVTSPEELMSSVFFEMG